MGGPGDPPEGTPEGGPGGAEDEYRSVVFDESFVRAARLQESSAHERVSDHAPAVRRRPPLRRGLTRQAVILMLLLAVAFGTAIFMGFRHPYGSTPPRRSAEPARMTVVPLAPRGKVPGAPDARTLYARSPAARFAVGLAGIPLPPSRPTAHFSDSQILAALDTARKYVLHSALDPDVLTGRQVRPVRALLDADQLDQFDRGLRDPVADGRDAPTGWMIRFDPARTALAGDDIRVRGALRVSETDPATLQVVADGTFVYALRAAGTEGRTPVSLFTVRRELVLRFDRDTLRVGQTRLTSSSTQAGPLSCAEDTSAYLRPLLAGERAKAGGPPGTDPYGTGAAALCGTLADSAQPGG
ncbi:SCO2583 family membrane protein [Streptomyces sp. NPDC001091]